MGTFRTIAIGIGIWGLGVCAYTGSFFIPMMENAEQQANLVLFLAVIPLVWFGSKLYYKNGGKTQGYKVGFTFFLVAALLDALITVPFLVVPNGGSYRGFFLDPGFWIIGLLFIGLSTMHWLKIKRTKEFI